MRAQVPTVHELVEIFSCLGLGFLRISLHSRDVDPTTYWGGDCWEVRFLNRDVGQGRVSSFLFYESDDPFMVFTKFMESLARSLFEDTMFQQMASSPDTMADSFIQWIQCAHPDIASFLEEPLLYRIRFLASAVWDPAISSDRATWWGSIPAEGQQKAQDKLPTTAELGVGILF